MSKHINVTEGLEGVGIGGYEYIYILTEKKWNEADYRLKFGGLVLVTDDKIQPRFIEDGNTVKRLPAEE